MKIISNNLIYKIHKIVYGTIEEYRNSSNFKKAKLEDYDNWKDMIIERILKLIEKEL